MLEEPKIKKVDKRDKQLPQNFEQLIEMYDVEKIWPYVLKMVQAINKDIPNDLNKVIENHDNDIKTLTENHDNDIQKLTENINNLIEQYGLEAVSNFFKSASKLIDFNTSGKGIAIGKVSEKDALEIAMDMYYKGELLSLEEFIKMSEVLPSGISFDDLMTTGKSSCYCISEYYGNTSLSGFPTGAYGYGTLITLNPQKRTDNAFSTFQIYLTDWLQNSTTIAAYGMFVRNKVNGNWRKIPICDEDGSLVALGGVKAIGGLLSADYNGNRVTIGSQNANWCHIYNSADVPFYFNRDIYVKGNNITPVIAYSNGSGTSGTVTLSVSADNYKHIRITYKNGDSQFGTTTMSANGSVACDTYGTIIRKNASDGAIMINSALFKISGTTITISRNSQAMIYLSNTTNTTDPNALYITKVELWN